MMSFNGVFPPWRCSGRQRRRGEGTHHPLGNKVWKKELHHQECALDKKLEDDALMEEKKERMGKHEIEGLKEGEKLNFEMCLIQLSFNFIHMAIIIGESKRKKRKPMYERSF